MADFTRRLPIYLLLDCSTSMRGEPIEAVNRGVQELVNDLKGNPLALETAYLSVITFNSEARQDTPLTELMQFTAPEIKAGGRTMLGEALELLLDCINKEVRKSTAEQKGDWKPLVFILTDGSPTDLKTFNGAIPKFKAANVANIIACVAGEKANTTHMKKLTECVLMINKLTPGDLAKFFAWVSSSVHTSVKNVDNGQGVGGFTLPPPPQNFVVIP